MVTMMDCETSLSKPMVSFIDNPIDPIFMENNIDYHNPLSPMEIARNKAEKATKDKKLVRNLFMSNFPTFGVIIQHVLSV